MAEDDDQEGEETPEKNPLLVEIRDAAGPFTFQNPTELTQWVKQEFQRWGFLTRRSQHFDLYQSFHNEVNGLATDWARILGDDSEDETIRKKIRSRIQHYFSTVGLIHSSSADGRFIERLREEDGDDAAAGATGALWRDGGDGATKGLVAAFLYRREIDFTATAHRKALMELHANYQSQIAAQAKWMEELEARNTELNSHFSTVLATHAEEIASQIGENKKVFQTSLNELAESKKAIEATYDQALALRRPVAYWEKVRTEHRTTSIRFAIAAGVVVVAFVVVMGLLIQWTLENVSATQPPQHWQVGILLLAAFLGIWIIRILVRLLMSNIHLAIDAGERKMMIRTYLALIREGSDVAPEDKKLILQHIFRNASDGLVKDDAAPPGMWDILTKR
jgi:hypothetical protein